MIIRRYWQIKGHVYNNTIWILLFPMHLPDNPTICTSDFFHVVYKCDQSLLKKKFSYAERTSSVKLVSHPGQASLLARSRRDLGWEIIAETKQRIHSYLIRPSITPTQHKLLFLTTKHKCVIKKTKCVAKDGESL